MKSIPVPDWKYISLFPSRAKNAKEALRQDADAVLSDKANAQTAEPLETLPEAADGAEVS
ncbi:MAG: hypothetical protein OXU79_11805 [Gemmatimonadota bacterium]|nr:hypothetical protein [Gemmatimonadota bacterium]